jgi:hypothetical protein
MLIAACLRYAPALSPQMSLSSFPSCSAALSFRILRVRTIQVTLNYLLRLWLYVPLRALASFAADAHSFLLFNFCLHVFTWSNRKSFSAIYNHFILARTSFLLLPGFFSNVFLLLFSLFSGRGVKLTIHLHPVPSSRMVELYLRSPMRLHGLMFN